MNNKYEEIEVLAGSSIDNVVEKLLEYNRRGEYACAKFNGLILYSDKVTIDSAYLDIVGISKLEFDKKYNIKKDK